jgi:hypothetical protein
VSPLFLRIYKHLLPTGQAWSITVSKTLRRFFEGLSDQPATTKEFIDNVYLDLFPETTRELNEWERQFGLPLTDTSGGDSDPAVIAARLALAAEWRAAGGQSPSYIQGVLQTAGFDVYVHEWWSSGPPYVARDPRDYTVQPLIGLYQCTGEPLAPLLPSQPECSSLASQPQCNNFLANETHYLVNLDLTLRAPPPVPDDPTKWPYFIYVGGETFGTNASVDIARRAEFERLLLKLRPLQNWIVLLVDYEATFGSFIITEGGDPIITESTDNLVT